jgi:LytS/YehU family sensor histidine kinase
MVVQLGDLLRRLLNAGEREYSSLADELHFARLYLELQRQRFADRLTFEMPDRAATPEAWVPSLILQPLIENAVVHGLAGHEDPVKVSVTARATGETLTLTVTNPAASAHPDHGEGVGLRNVRERLAVQYGRAASFTAGRTDGLWVATISLPHLRELPRLASAHA